VNERTKEYVNILTETVNTSKCFTSTKDYSKLGFIEGFSNAYYGKVRDIYFFSNFVVLFTTDRQSAFDRQLAVVPFKGQVLHLTSLWWFEKTKHLVPNHVISSPNNNVLIAKRTKVFPIEFVVRGYITGSTSTSLWTHYSKGVRNYCGHIFPDGLRKNQKLDKNILTPTTKDDAHDELISAEEILSRNIMTPEDWERCSNYAEILFNFSQTLALEKGLILVDTKYEFGKDTDGNILLIDEVQTPDSSRYWIADTYQSRFDVNEEPDNIDKEFLRKWYVSHCDPYKDLFLPDAPLDLVVELSRR
jgi:phosphoribosylaminoimidazole-succinocarboxamide synthase